MAQVLRRRGRIQVKVDKREREALIGIIDSLSRRLAAPLASAPRAYDDAKLQAEYDRWVAGIEKGREADLTMVREALSGGEDTLPLTEAQTLVWLRAFNHLRVAAGEILGIEGDGWEEIRDRHHEAAARVRRADCAGISSGGVGRGAPSTCNRRGARRPHAKSFRGHGDAWRR